MKNSKKLESLISNAGIVSTDKDKVFSTFTSYDTYVERGVNLEKVNFFKSYLSCYKHLCKTKNHEGRELLVNGVHKISELSSHKSNIGAGLNLLARFLEIAPKKVKKYEEISWFPLPIKTVDLWIKSLDHLEDPKRTAFSKSLGLTRYLRISNACLAETHPSQDHVLKLIAEKKTLHGLENFFFSLARNQNLDEKTTRAYFENLKKIDFDSRTKIEDTRKKIRIEKRPQLDFEIYQLLSLDNHTEASRRDSALLLYKIAQSSTKDPTKDLENTIGIAREVAEKDSTLMMQVLKGGIAIFKLQSPKKGIEKVYLIPSYLEVVKYIAGLNISSNEKPIYTRFACELFKDYYDRTNEFSRVEDVQEKCYKSIGDLVSLDVPSRSTAVVLLQSSMRNLKRGDRLNFVNDSCRLYLDKLVGIITKSIRKAPKRAGPFITKILNYEYFRETR